MAEGGSSNPDLDGVVGLENNPQTSGNSLSDFRPPPYCVPTRLSEQIDVAFVDFMLKPYVTHIKSYVRDTNDVLEYLNSPTGIDQGTILASLNLSSLYTNILNEEGIMACHHF